MHNKAIGSKNIIKLQPVPPSMPSEALSVRFLDIHSASSGIDGGTCCNFIFFRIDIVSSIREMSVMTSSKYVSMYRTQPLLCTYQQLEVSLSYKRSYQQF